MFGPNAGMIEAAADTLSQSPGRYPIPSAMVLAEELRELKEFGDDRAQQLSLVDPETLSKVNATGLSVDFRLGYLLGLQTARMILADSGALAMKGVDPNDVF